MATTSVKIIKKIKLVQCLRETDRQTEFTRFIIHDFRRSIFNACSLKKTTTLITFPRKGQVIVRELPSENLILCEISFFEIIPQY